jgi:hypothetical protein
MALLPNPPCQLSLWGKLEYPEETHDFRQSVDFLLFSHEDWIRVALRKFSLTLEPAALEVKGKCANHFATETSLNYLSRLYRVCESCSWSCLSTDMIDVLNWISLNCCRAKRRQPPILDDVYSFYSCQIPARLMYFSQSNWDLFVVCDHHFRRILKLIIYRHQRKGWSIVRLCKYAVVYIKV